MPTTWIKADLTWSAAAYTWSDFSVATELLYMVEGGRSGKYKRDKWGRVIDGPYADFFKDSRSITKTNGEYTCLLNYIQINRKYLNVMFHSKEHQSKIQN